MRTEQDMLGEKQIPNDALYGIHSVRAKENFPDSTPFHIEWYKAMGLTKLACYHTYKSFKSAINQKYKDQKLPLDLMNDKILEALMKSAKELAEGKYFDHFIIPAIQGGAGTSINMNINEILANASIIKLGKDKGCYEIIDPIENANVFQSTNDVVPTALKVATIQLLVELEEVINNLRSQIEKLENQHRNTLRIAHTQMQEAVPSTYAMLLSTYNEALSRDWWRVSKCFERIKVVNLGGSAVGTGVSVPRFFIMEVVPTLQKLTKLPITRSENLPDTNNNLDVFVEVHAILKAHAVNLEKMVSDIRLLASDVAGGKEVSIPQKQVGSSIMPGKINPVIPEYIVSVAHKIYSNDQIVSSLSAQGCLDLNAYIPIIGHALLDSIKLLIGANVTLRENLFEGMTISDEKSNERLYSSPSITTALSTYIGYHKASELAVEMKKSKISVFEANKKLGTLDPQKLTDILSPQKLSKLGFTIDDII